MPNCHICLAAGLHLADSCSRRRGHGSVSPALWPIRDHVVQQPRSLANGRSRFERVGGMGRWQSTRSGRKCRPELESAGFPFAYGRNAHPGQQQAAVRRASRYTEGRELEGDRLRKARRFERRHQRDRECFVRTAHSCFVLAIFCNCSLFDRAIRVESDAQKQGVAVEDYLG